MSLAVVIGHGKPNAKAQSSEEPGRNFSEERLRHASRLVKAVHEHDVEGADDAMRAHHAVCSDEDDAHKE